MERDDELNRISMVKMRYQGIWMGLNNVSAVGVGITSDGRPGIIISMKREDVSTRKLFPAEIEGIPVEINISGNINIL
jgi:hypothetical protein